MAYLRRGEPQTLMVIGNFRDNEILLNLENILQNYQLRIKEVLLDNYPENTCAAWLEKEDKKDFICKLGALQGMVLALE